MQSIFNSSTVVAICSVIGLAFTYLTARIVLKQKTVEASSDITKESLKIIVERLDKAESELALMRKFQSDYTNLLEKYEDLSNKYKSLKDRLGDYKMLIEKYDDLSTKYTNLKNKYDLLKQELDSYKKENEAK